MLKIGKIKELLVDKDRGDFNHGKVEYDGNDVAEHVVLTLPNIEVQPKKDDNVFISDTDQNGIKAITGLPLKSKIKEGELRLVAFDQDGAEISNFYFKVDGQLEITTKSLISIKNENESLKALVDELLSILLGFETKGSPWHHFTAPETRQKISQLKSKFNNLLK